VAATATAGQVVWQVSYACTGASSAHATQRCRRSCISRAAARPQCSCDRVAQRCECVAATRAQCAAAEASPSDLEKECVLGGVRTPSLPSLFGKDCVFGNEGGFRIRGRDDCCCMMLFVTVRAEVTRVGPVRGLGAISRRRSPPEPAIPAASGVGEAAAAAGARADSDLRAGGGGGGSMDGFKRSRLNRRSGGGGGNEDGAGGGRAGGTCVAAASAGSSAGAAAGSAASSASGGTADAAAGTAAGAATGSVASAASGSSDAGASGIGAGAVYGKSAGTGGKSCSANRCGSSEASECRGPMQSSALEFASRSAKSPRLRVLQQPKIPMTSCIQVGSAIEWSRFAGSDIIAARWGGGRQRPLSSGSGGLPPTSRS